MIVRVKKQDAFFVMDKTGVNDSRLGYKAVGLLAQLLSRPNHWEARVEELVAAHADGVASVRAGMAELIRFGYMVRLKFVFRGKVLGWRTDTYEAPALNPYFDPSLEEQPGQVTVSLEEDEVRAFLDQGPDAEKPDLGFPNVENRMLVNNDISNNNSFSSPTAPSAPVLSAEPSLDETPADPAPSPVEAKPEKPRKPRESKAYVNPETGIGTEAIRQAYLEALEQWEPGALVNHAEVGRWARQIAAQGFVPADVELTFHTLKRDPWWSGRHLSLGALSKQIAATIAKAKNRPAPAAASKAAPKSARQRMKDL